MTNPTKHSLENLQHAFQSTFVGMMEEKYRPWLYESPVFLDRSRIDFLEKSQGIMLKLMRYIGEHYDAVAAYLPHDAVVKSFLTQLQDVPFKEGTFRTDFVINEQDEIRLIEVTCRFPLNGYFRSLAANTMNRASYFEDKYKLKEQSYCDAFLEKFLKWMGDADRLIIIRGQDQRDNESKYMKSILPAAKIDLQFLFVRRVVGTRSRVAERSSNYARAHLG